MTDMLLESPERLHFSPERRLRAWEQGAKQISQLVNAPLAELGRELSRSVLVNPTQSLDATPQVVARLLTATPISPEERLPVADAFNALACIGGALPDIADEKIVYWLPGLTAVEPPLPGRIRAGFIALTLGDLLRAGYVTPDARGPLFGGCEFPNDMLALLGYAKAGVRSGGARAMFDNALERAGEELDELCATNQLDEATVLWMSRLLFHRLDGRPLGTVAACAHDWLWKIPAHLADARRTVATRAPEFPIAHTLGGGRFRVEGWLRGTGAQRLCRGVEVASGDHVLIAIDDHSPRRQNIDELRTAISYHAPGLFELVHVGKFDDEIHHWATVEKVSTGNWLPAILGPADPWTAPRKAIELGSSAGEILLRAAEAGIVQAQRPEFIWAERKDGRYAVTGLSARAIELFRRARAGAFTTPCSNTGIGHPKWTTSPMIAP